MKVELSRIDIEPQPFAERVELSVDDLDSALVVGPMAVDVTGEVCRVADGLRAEGRVVASGSVRCGRCLEPVSWHSDETFAVTLLERPVGPEAIPGDEDDREVVFIDGDHLDIAELAAEQVLLALPVRILCRDDCAGLCPRCGGNRNVEGACRCDDETDPRWNALRDLKARLSPKDESGSD